MRGIVFKTSPMKHSFQSSDLSSEQRVGDMISSLTCVLEVPSWSDIVVSRVLPESVWSRGCCSGFGALLWDPCHSP